MDIRQLDYFLAIAERGSITGAAAFLNVTQPTLTKSLRLLEQEFGVLLFERQPRGMALTVFGQSLMKHARAVRVQFADAAEELESLREGADGQVLIGAGPAWLRRQLPLAVARTLRDRPRLKVRIFGGFDEALTRSLRHGDLDFVVAELPLLEAETDLELEPLTTDLLGVVCREDHPLSRRSRVDLKTLLGYPWALPANNPRARRRLESVFLSHDIKPPVPTVETESMAFMFALLRESDTLTYTTASTVRSPDGRGLMSLHVPALRGERSAGIMRRRGSWIAPAAQAVIDELRNICREDPLN